MDSTMTATLITAPEMNEQEARQAVDDIKRGINTVRARIYDLDRRKGWKALGYRSFAACCMEEFPELHARTIEKQLGAARVEAKLQDLRHLGGTLKLGTSLKRIYARLSPSRMTTKLLLLHLAKLKK